MNTINKQEITENEVIGALQEFGTSSFQLVGAENTYLTIKFMTGLIQSNPTVYQKLFKPENLQEIQKLIAETSGKKPDVFTVMQIVPRIQKIFK